MRIGHGYDVHRLVKERPLILGGVKIESDVGLLGHSDADVLIHAIMDSFLGAAALGDIGQHFPDNNPTYKGADSMKLLKIVSDMLKKNNYKIQNLDATIIAQSPKLSPYIPRMKENISKICEIDSDCVNVKATTEESLGFTGRKEGIAAHCVCIID